MKEIYIVNCCRTAVGSFGGSLKDTSAADMGGLVIKEALNRAGVKAEQVDEVITAYVLKVDGQFIGAASTEGALTSLLATVTAPYENENTISTSFLQRVSISREDVPANVEQSISRMTEILTANTNGETQYEVQKGDTFMQIAYDNDMDMADLQALNPEQDI
ncbi:MAG: LysM peptidoglycan-binding domain-containing protein, partial [Lawsonibacter sp.]